VNWSKLDATRQLLGSTSRTLILLGRVPGVRRAKFITRFGEFMTRMNIQATVLDSWRPSRKDAEEATKLASEYGLLVLIGSGWWDKLLATGDVRDLTDGMLDFHATVCGHRMRVLKFQDMGSFPIAEVEMHLNWVSLESR